jgi:hypothetical protein
MHSRDRTRMMIRTVARATAWFALAAIIVLSLVPPGIRPSTYVPHKIEHAGIFLLDGVAFGIAYCGYQWLASVMAVLFCAGIEVAQLAVPGRHARLSDFFVDAIAICVGIFGGSTLIRAKPGRKALIASGPPQDVPPGSNIPSSSNGDAAPCHPPR